MREVIALAHQGLALGGPAEVGFDKRTLPYVPGSVLRGALAAAWIRENGTPDRDNPRRSEFVELFEGEVLYGPLFQDGTTITPLSAICCKYPQTDQCARWSVDAAVDEQPSTCPHCGGGIETGKGDVVGVIPRRVLRTRLDENGRALDGHLFARHELPRGLTYRGRIAGTHAWLEPEREIWLGGRTTTSGLTTLRSVPLVDGPHAGPSPRADGALVVRLVSPAIVVDDVGRPSLDLVPEITRVLGVPVAASRAWTRPQRVGGWHAASGLPKPVEMAVSMGSVVVLHLATQPDQDRLDRLIRTGIGLRRNEGFGMVEVNPAPWRLTVPEAREDEPVRSPLDDLRRLGVLDSRTRVQWLLDRCRRVLVDRERGHASPGEDYMRERVAFYFDDEQAEAVRAMFASEQLATAIPLLEQTLRGMN